MLEPDVFISPCSCQWTRFSARPTSSRMVSSSTTTLSRSSAPRCRTTISRGRCATPHLTAGICCPGAGLLLVGGGGQPSISPRGSAAWLRLTAGPTASRYWCRVCFLWSSPEIDDLPYHCPRLPYLWGPASTRDLQLFPEPHDLHLSHVKLSAQTVLFVTALTIFYIDDLFILLNIVILRM